MNQLKKNFPYTTIGLNMAVGMAVFTLLGYAIGNKTGQMAGCLLIGIALGLFYCGYEVWKLIKQTNQKNDLHDS